MTYEIRALSPGGGADFLAASALGGGPRPQAKGAGAEEQDIERVARDFSAVLVQNVVREMFESVKEGEGPFGSGPGSDIQRSMAESALSQSLAERGLESLQEAIAQSLKPRGNVVTPEEAMAEIASRKAPRTEESDR